MKKGDGKEYRTWPLKSWTKMFNDIYGQRNEKRTNLEVLSYVSMGLGKLAKTFRKDYAKRDKGKILDNIASIFAWSTEFATRFGDLEDMLWHKFPSVCPYCFYEQDCDCINEPEKLSEEERESKLIILRKDNLKIKPKNLYGWQEMWEKIYGKTNAKQAFSTLGWHLTEEICFEIPDALEKYENALEIYESAQKIKGEYSKKDLIKISKDKNERFRELKDEIADGFAWISTIVSKCAVSDNKKHRIDDIVYKAYPYQCRHCQDQPCDC